jgi:hypothetical protein
MLDFMDGVWLAWGPPSGNLMNILESIVVTIENSDRNTVIVVCIQDASYNELVLAGPTTTRAVVLNLVYEVFVSTLEAPLRSLCI